jgi:hypothetical protein
MTASNPRMLFRFACAVTGVPVPRNAAGYPVEPTGAYEV